MIGFLGGTFDPIHYGHLRPANEVLGTLGLVEMRVVPAFQPPHRQAPVASAAQRLCMAELAVQEFPRFIADDREIRRGGASYTVPTLEALRAEIGAVPLCLLLGSDAFAGLPTWHRWERVFELAHIVVMRRPGAALPSGAASAPWVQGRLAKNATDVAGQPAGRVVFVTVTPQDVSATRLRAQIARGETPSLDHIPPSVWDYITRHNLYRSTAA